MHVYCTIVKGAGKPKWKRKIAVENKSALRRPRRFGGFPWPLRLRCSGRYLYLSFSFFSAVGSVSSAFTLSPRLHPAFTDVSYKYPFWRRAEEGRGGAFPPRPSPHPSLPSLLPSFLPSFSSRIFGRQSGGGERRGVKTAARQPRVEPDNSFLSAYATQCKDGQHHSASP